MTIERIARALAIIGCGLFLAISFRAGWNRAATDFPNYYTAAVLVRKGEPVRKYYDWTWFQRQMNYAGVEAQLGSYVPQTPLTMLPIVPLAQFPVQTAKRLWLLLNLGFLAGTVWLLSRVTRFSFAMVALIAFVGHGTLTSNFLLGQYYVFLLFLLTLAYFYLERNHAIAGGAMVGLAFVLKLYAGPLFLFLAIRRQWKALMAAMAVTLCAICLTWSDTAYFGRYILPRATAGDLVDPYNAAYQTISTLLRRTFVFEPELNPHPQWNAPWLFFLLGPLIALTLLALPLAGARTSHFKQSFAWFFIAIVLASTSTATYTFVLLLLPVTLLLDEEGWLGKLAVLGCYAVAAMPLRPAWVPFFPKIWVLLALYLIAGRHGLRALRAQQIAAVAVVVLTGSVLIGYRAIYAYQREPGRRWEQITTEAGAISSSSPATLRTGLVYQAMGKKHYELGYLHDGHVTRFAFDGDALLPEAVSPDGPIRFELVSHGRSQALLLDPANGQVSPATSASASAKSQTSPDGRWTVFACSNQICLRSKDGKTMQLTDGNCNSYTPVWEPDSSGIVFASDCDRGLGLPALYRARVANINFDQAPGVSTTILRLGRR